MRCEALDCDREARRSGLCWGHAKRESRRKPQGPLASRSRSHWEVLADAANAYADALSALSADEDFLRAEARLRMAALRYARRTVSTPKVTLVDAPKERRRARAEDSEAGSVEGPED